jgi:hypothetical protein
MSWNPPQMNESSIILSELEARKTRATLARIGQLLSPRKSVEPESLALPANAVNLHHKAIRAARKSLSDMLSTYDRLRSACYGDSALYSAAGANRAPRWDGAQSSIGVACTSRARAGAGETPAIPERSLIRGSPRCSLFGGSGARASSTPWSGCWNSRWPTRNLAAADGLRPR